MSSNVGGLPRIFSERAESIELTTINNRYFILSTHEECVNKGASTRSLDLQEIAAKYLSKPT